MNKVILLGNLTRDVELNTTNNGISVARFSIAVKRNFPNQNNEYESDFFNIVVWRGLAENCHKFLKKGSKCAVFGRLQNNIFEAQDGTKRYNIDVVADEVEFLTLKQNNEENKVENQPKSQPQAQQMELTPIDDDNLPWD